MQHQVMNGLALFLISLALALISPVNAVGVSKQQIIRSYSKLRSIGQKSNERKIVLDVEDEMEQVASGVEDVLRAKANLRANAAEQRQTKAQLDHLQNLRAANSQIDASAALVSSETESKALGKMLGKMWKEIRMFGMPHYETYIKGKLTHLKKSEGKIRAELSTLQGKKAREESHAEEMDSDMPEEVSVQVPVVDAPNVFPVPTTSRCVVIMVVHYMIIYTVLALCRAYHEAFGIAKGKIEAGLCAAVQTLTYAPMLCVLFIAYRMRIQFLSDGTDQPPIWAQACMYALTFAFLASTLLVLAISVTSDAPLKLREGSGDLEKVDSDRYSSRIVFYVLTGIRYLLLLGLYGGLAGVIFGICTYTPPGISDLSELPLPSPAVLCTMILTVVFFTAQLVIALCRSYTEYTGIELPKIVSTMLSASNTVEFAPQLSILFIAARMRALQHDGQPQEWAQHCMIAATAALCISAVLTCAIPLVMSGPAKTSSSEDERGCGEVNNQTFAYALVGLRFACMLGFYGGAVGVILSIIKYESPKGSQHTLPLSPTVQCVMVLTGQFFFVYVIQTIMLTVSEVSGRRIPVESYRCYSAVDAAKSTLGFAPMLCILFVTTRMYALAITDNKGAPQAWAEDGMYMSTWSLLISFVACLATGLFLDKVETDDDGNVINEISNKCVSMAISVVRFLSMLLLYGGIVLVIVGLFTMTPETANGRGSVPVVSDVVNSTPVGNPPLSLQGLSAVIRLLAQKM